MKSTGEVMGVGQTFAEAFYKSQLASGERLPAGGKAIISVRDADKPRTLEIARKLASLGFGLVATRGTAAALAAAGIPVTPVNKVAEGRPHIVDLIKNGEISIIVNTVEEKRTAVRDSYAIRRAALQERVALYTTLDGARAACSGIEHSKELRAYVMQGLHAALPVSAN
jgi:carbamoyl-phosphate synthase large subunit